ncbi:hypothetical protein AB1Y20_003373 [Prymnesium parvum]|uniref:Radical SAM core domain-containing protein n=1 Tax=Prymnesium parvum TaxID=97485 RepID=A0AB34JCV0_PRYPA
MAVVPWLLAARGLLPPPTATRGASLLSLPLSTLSDVAGGAAAAQYLWRHLRRGEDPSQLFRSELAAAEACGVGLHPARRHQLESSLRPLSALARLVLETVAADGTRKLLLRLHDGLEVEAVLIPPLPRGGRKAAPNARRRTTLCLSSQVGCRQGCAFCATGRMGRVRDLSADEILAQAFLAKRAGLAAALPPLSNVVFMGMGEPADNAASVRAAVECLTDPQRFSFSPTAVVVSTVAPSPRAFRALLGLDAAAAADERGPALAWSLHSADPALRQLLVPTATHPPARLRDGLCEALLRRPPRRRRVLIEYVLIAGVNDAEADAELLAEFLQPVHSACFVESRNSTRTGVLVNLIPYNAGDGAAAATSAMGAGGQREATPAVPRTGIPHYSHFRRPSAGAVRTFQRILRGRGVWASVRATRGDDSASACGQLATSRRRSGTSARDGEAAPAAAASPLVEYRRASAARERIEEAMAKQLHCGADGVHHRCCVACQGHGQLFLRRRRATQGAPPLARCVCCEGTGLLPAGHLSEGRSLRPPAASTAYSPTVAVVGGGIGGLAAALALQQRGVDVAVFERDGSFFERSQGYGLTLQQGWSSVRALGVAEAVAAAGVSSTRHVAMDAQGRVLGTHGSAAQDSPPRGRRRNVHVPRQSLRAILHSRLSPGTVRWGHRFEGVLPSENGGVEISFHEGTERVHAQLLVGADGIHSRVRQAVWESAGSAAGTTLRPLNMMVILGFAPCNHDLCAKGDTVFEVVDGTARVYAMPFSPPPDLTTMWQLSFPLDAAEAQALAALGGAALLDEARRRCIQLMPSLIDSRLLADLWLGGARWWETALIRWLLSRRKALTKRF